MNNNTYLCNYIIRTETSSKSSLLEYANVLYKNTTNNISVANFSNIIKLLHRINIYLWRIFNVKHSNTIPLINDASIIENVAGCTPNNLNILKQFLKIITNTNMNGSYTLLSLIKEHGTENFLNNKNNFEIYENMKFNHLLSFIRENHQVLFLFGVLELSDYQVYSIVKLFTEHKLI